jgi:hypothetical protein
MLEPVVSIKQIREVQFHNCFVSGAALRRKEAQTLVCTYVREKLWK